ncbi:MAG: hypothetical protein U9R50_08760 [Campylobacterota bacterium]|nr:hypothetical protein [Campylobacterota bacterium]
MTDKQIQNMNVLREKIEKNFPNTKIVTLNDLTKNIAKVSNVRVRACTIDNYHEIGVDSIDEKGVLHILDTQKQYSSANKSAIESQRLHKGDLIFGYRGKMGKVGLVTEEFKTPVVTNNGMIRITFEEDRLEETPQYVQTYLSSKLISTYLNSMLDNRNGKKVLYVSTIENLPIPYFEEMGGISKFTTMLTKRKKMSLAVRSLIEEAQTLLEIYQDMESESITLQTLSLEELSSINNDDHNKEKALNQITTKLQILKKHQSSKNILSMEFIPPSV